MKQGYTISFSFNCPSFVKGKLRERIMLKNPEEEHPKKAFGWAARVQSEVLSPFKFFRRATGEKDVALKVLYCGICHSDVHMINNDWGLSYYPLVPGHEIVGEVNEVGSKVEKFRVGDKIGVGFIVGSCRSCENCANNLENYCPNYILTYSSKDYDGTITYGGYSDILVVNEHFVVHIPEKLPLHAAAPLLCAGITVYSPLRYFELDKPGLHLGVVGLGGLGHMAVKFAKVMGAKVTVISTSPHKKKEAMENLGADSFLVSYEQDQLESHGKLIMLGGTVKPLELPIIPLLAGRKIIGGGVSGGMKETQEMIDFAAKHNIIPEVEVIPMEYVNTAMERLVKADVKYRFVIDIGNTLKNSCP
ncbi:Alcohol dehydrogenase-like [Theobroma cacao]|nr:Alcohol dehydrogenase-like [Theobroma cacao]